MATRSEEFFHDKWLGMVQSDSDGLVVAKPVLLEAQCANKNAPDTQEKLRELCPLSAEDAPRHIVDLMPFFLQMLDFDEDLFDKSSDIPDEVSLYAPEGPQTIRPTLGLLRQDDAAHPDGPGSPASDAAAKYVALLWDVTEIEGEPNPDAIGLALDKPETTTGEWSYPVSAKFDRLLRHCRVPVGILTNREVIRLVYAPHGESSGHITFRVDDMATVGGRPILDAMIMLLCANQWFGVSEENSLPSLLRRSREYQGTVTKDLAEQVFSGLEELLKGFQTAAERDKSGLLREALERDEDYLYRGLLTVMLRMVFVLYAEDRNLLPVDHPLYAKQMSLLGLFERLQRDHGNFPDSMNNRFGAWGHIISLSRAIYLGVEHEDFHIPPRQGALFDPHAYPFLEGWTGESAPVVTQKARSEVRVPTVDDGTVFALLRSLLIFQGQRLSYRTLDVEQIGSVYEALMGYHVSICESPALAIKIKNKKGAPKYWVEPEAVLARPSSHRAKWLKDACGFDKPIATKIKKALDALAEKEGGNQNAAIEALLPLAAGKKGLAHEQQASVGQYILQPGSERRRSGTQYTPRSLTEPIVRKTLEPLIRCLGEEPTAAQLLELKLCDPAMGSGAFLVECCRQLADEVVLAWGRAHEVEKIAANCLEGDVIAHARRLVAQQCLYGVDKNTMAVQLAKLSLWLFTLARELPFTFLDHSFRHGDSLVGLDLEQIKGFHWKPERQLGLFEREITRALDEVVAIRQEIHELASDSTPAGQKFKAQRLFDANDATEKVRCIADVCVGAFFAEQKDRDREKERTTRLDLVVRWIDGEEELGPQLEEARQTLRSRVPAFHWMLEFPEVFYSGRPDPLEGTINKDALVDGFIGNPPFSGGNQITAGFGSPTYVEWLKKGTVGASGHTDLCAYFFRRAVGLLGVNGTAGFLATNTIAEGDSRSAGLQTIVADGAIIYDAERSFPWPGEATVSVSRVHLALGSVVDFLPKPRLDGDPVAVINSQLLPFPERPDPIRLAANLEKCFQGTNMMGLGFLVTPEQRRELIELDQRNTELIQPYIGGREVNTSPTHDFERYVINFGARPLDEAEMWPDLLEIVREKVKPDRDAAKNHGPGLHGKKYWWQHVLRKAPLYNAIESLPQCLTTLAQASKHLTLAFVPTDRVFANSLNVFPLADYSQFACLQSRVHESWARLLCSSFGEGLRYNPTDCFVTFPFPASDPTAKHDELEIGGERLYAARAKYMVQSQHGMTETYNLLMDPSVDDEETVGLREAHREMDRAVLKAYGWSDLDVPPFGTPATKSASRELEAFQYEVIDRLFVLNAERAGEEKQGGTGKNEARKRAGRESAKASDATMNLPGMSDFEPKKNS